MIYHCHYFCKICKYVKYVVYVSIAIPTRECIIAKKY